MAFSKNIMDKQDDDHRRFAERVNENHNTMNANIQTLKEDLTHTKESIDNVNNTLQALLRQRHHSRSSRSSRTRSSRPRDHKAKRTVKLALHLSLMRPIWRPPMLIAKVHISPNKKAKASHKIILYLHKNYFDNNKLRKLKLGKTKSTAVTRTWNKQNKSTASSS